MSNENGAAPEYRGRVPIARVLELRDQGLKHKEIAVEVGVPMGTISSTLHMLGLTSPRGTLPPQIAERIAERAAEVQRLHREGYLQREIADRLGLSGKTVSKYVNQVGVHVPGRRVGGDPDRVDAVLAASRRHLRLAQIAREAGVSVDQAKRILERRGGGWRQGMAGTVLDSMTGTAAKQVDNLPELTGLRGRRDYDALISDYGVDAVEEWIEKLDRDRRALERLRRQLRAALNRSGAGVNE